MTYAGMLTVTDFIRLILYYYGDQGGDGGSEEGIEGLRIARLKEIVMRGGGVWKLNPMDSLYDAARILLGNRLHRLPLIDISPDGQEMILSVLTQHKILRYLSLTYPASRELRETPRELGVGTWSNIATIKTSTPLIDLLYLFIKRRISALPIVDDAGVLVTVVEKYDILSLAREGSKYNLELGVGEVLKCRTFSGGAVLHVADESEGIGGMMEVVGRERVKRFFVVGSKGGVVGVVSLSDLLGYYCRIE